jgi:23S rRNA-intervening sequence protein
VRGAGALLNARGVMGISHPAYIGTCSRGRKDLRLAQRVYETTATFPTEERFGLVGQMRKAAVSIVSNVAEGAARDSRREFSRFLSVARGSLAELVGNDPSDSLSRGSCRRAWAMDGGRFIRGTELLRQLERTGQLLTVQHTSIRARTLTAR